MALGENRDGRATKAVLFGEERAFQARPITEELAPIVAEISDRVLWGEIWSGDGLDLRTRSMVTITTLLALERYEYAKLHMHGARRLGIERQELVEIAVQMLFYVGLPVVHTALRMIHEVFEGGLDDMPDFPSQPDRPT